MSTATVTFTSQEAKAIQAVAAGGSPEDIADCLRDVAEAVSGATPLVPLAVPSFYVGGDCDHHDECIAFERSMIARAKPLSTTAPKERQLHRPASPTVVPASHKAAEARLLAHLGID